jgi:hypothetical protein
MNDFARGDGPYGLQNDNVFRYYNKEIIETLPETEGFYRLLDERYNLIAIVGTANRRGSLKEKLEAESPGR